MKIFKRLLSVVIFFLIVAGLLSTWLFRQEILDWWVLRDYQPPTAVVQLADSTTMTDKARRIFYVNRPEISNATEFNSECSQETSIVLGCYAPGRGIFLYNIDDPRLSGVKEVTAAHEMLHAAYDRLPTRDKIRINGLTQSAYLELTNPRIKANIAKYQAQDPGSVPNELHSILATEVGKLPAELEEYYKTYFSNRLAVVALSEHYEAEFTSREKQVNDFDEQLTSLKLEIDGLNQDLDLQHKALVSEKERLDGILRSGDVKEYNQLVSGYNAQVNDYNLSVKNAEKLIANYNQTVKKRNDIALEVKDLAQSIDSRPQTL